ncbi:MAG TPA: hypothetical protein VIK74_07525 [Parasegetibacter sp.]
MSIHQPAQPTGVVVPNGTNLAFLSALGIQDRSFDKELMEVYGPENYCFFTEKMGKFRVTENEEFYHYEANKSFPSVQVASGGSGTPGANATIVIAAASHTNGGTQSPLRVGEVVEIMASGIMGKITQVNKTTPNAHTATIAPLLATDAFNPSANDYLLFKGLQDEGEASDTREGISDITRKVTNTITEFREDFTITDKASMERIEWSFGGRSYYKYRGTKQTEKRFLGSMEDKLVFGTPVTNTNIANGTKGTKGMLSQVGSGGSTLDYAAGALDIADFQAMIRIFDQNGAPAEVHMLNDQYQFQEIQDALFAKYQNGSILWDSVGGKEAAAKYGFKSLQIENYTFHWKKYAPFSPAWKYGVLATQARYHNFGVAIPQGQHTDPRTGDVGPTLEIRYQNVPGHGSIYAWDHGGLSSKGTNGKLSVTNSFAAYRGLQLKAANQCVILQGS